MSLELTGPVGGFELGWSVEASLEPFNVPHHSDLHSLDRPPAALGAHARWGMHSASNSELNASAIALSSGQVRHPRLVRRSCDELPLDHARGTRPVSAPPRGSLANLPSPDAAQRFGLHQPPDGTPGHAMPSPIEFGPDLLGAVDTDVVGVDLPDQRHQIGVADRPRQSGRGRRLEVEPIIDTLRSAGVEIARAPTTPLGIEDPVTVLVDIGHDHFSWRSSAPLPRQEQTPFTGPRWPP